MRTLRRSLPVLLAAVVLAPPAHAERHRDDHPLEEARRAAQAQPFTAHVRVRWTDEHGTHHASLDVESAGGVVEVVGPDPGQVWPGSLAPTVPLADKYWVTAEPGGYIAGRPTRAVAVLEDGRLVERLAIDEETGIILRRERYGPDGRIDRVVEVAHLMLPGTARVKPGAAGARRVSEPDLPAAVRAPERLAGGWRRIGAHERAGSAHLHYSDGLHGLSVFAQLGSLATRDLPPGGERVRVGSREGVRYGWAGGEVVTWEANGVVYTAVADAPLDELLAAASSLPGARALSVAARLRHACRALVETVTGGR